MVSKDIVKLAEEYCTFYHQTQRRKGGNQDPYDIHPFTVRDILVRFGYDSSETQAIALLHDTIEDTELGRSKTEIEKRFGTIIYEGVYILSNNTVGKHAETVSPLFDDLGVQLMNEKRLLTPQAYKMRILFSRDSIKRIKIADMIHNTSSLSDLNISGIERKLQDADNFYIPLGKVVAPVMVNELINNISNYKQSEHYHNHFG